MILFLYYNVDLQEDDTLFANTTITSNTFPLSNIFIVTQGVGDVSEPLFVVFRHGQADRYRR